MLSNKSHTTTQTTSHRQRQAFRPQLESLEDRCLLSAGALDPTFGSGGIVTTDLTRQDQARALAIYPTAGMPNDGKVVAAGYADNGSKTSNNFDFALVRYNSHGTLDMTFSGDGKLTTAFGSSHDYANAVAIQADGKIVAAGSASINKNDDFALVRYNVNGSLDADFDGDGKVTTNFTGSGRFASSDGANAMAIQAEGKIVLAGFSNFNIAVARYDVYGRLDITFDGDGKVVTPYSSVPGSLGFSAKNMAIYPSAGTLQDGKIVVVGTTKTSLSLYDVFVVRYNANGSLDSSFGSTGIVTLPRPTDDGGYDAGKTVAIQADGKIVLAWPTRNGTTEDTVLVRFNVDGSLDTTFGVNGTVLSSLPTTNEYVSSLALQADGKIVVAGSQDNSFFAARYSADGGLDPNYGVNGIATTALFGHASAVAVQSDGKVALAGYTVRSVGSTTDYDFALARFLGDDPVAALQAASIAHKTVTQKLNRDQIQLLIPEAFARWQTAGVDASSLHGIDLRITDLGGTTLGLASGNIIWLDDNAAGWGWFVDSTPWDDSEFNTPGDQGEQNRMDLLGVLMHELGHLLGHEHEEDGVMAETLASGTRLTLPDAAFSDADWLVGLPDFTKKRDPFGWWS